MHFNPFSVKNVLKKSGCAQGFLLFVFAMSAWLIGSPAEAQKHYITNQYVYDLYLMNPAAAGFYKNCFIANGYVQKQWFGTDDSPSTQILSAQTALSESLGSGTYIYNDKNGFFKEMGLQQSFSYEVMIAKNSRTKSFTKLMFGLSLNLEQSSLSYDGLTNDELMDPVVMNGSDNGWGLNANTGMILLSRNFHMGVSVTNLFSQPNSMMESDLEPNVPKDLHLYMSSVFKWPGIDLYIEPLLYYRRNSQANSRMDLNAKLTVPTMNSDLSFWGLLAYRRTMDKDAGIDLGSAVTVGTIYKRINFGLEYQLGHTSAQSHYGSYYQLILGYRFCHDRFNGAIDCPGKKKGKRVNDKYTSY